MKVSLVPQDFSVVTESVRMFSRANFAVISTIHTFNGLTTQTRIQTSTTVQPNIQDIFHVVRLHRKCVARILNETRLLGQRYDRYCDSVRNTDRGSNPQFSTADFIIFCIL